jgi:hypothetical protein
MKTAENGKKQASQTVIIEIFKFQINTSPIDNIVYIIMIHVIHRKDIVQL